MFIPIFSQPLHTDENGNKYWRDDALNAYCKSVGVAAYVWIIETQTGRRSRILVNTNGDILEDSPDMDTIKKPQINYGYLFNWSTLTTAHVASLTCHNAN